MQRQHSKLTCTAAPGTPLPSLPASCVTVVDFDERRLPVGEGGFRKLLNDAGIPFVEVPRVKEFDTTTMQVRTS